MPKCCGSSCRKSTLRSMRSALMPRCRRSWPRPACPPRRRTPFEKRRCRARSGELSWRACSIRSLPRAGQPRPRLSKRDMANSELPILVAGGGIGGLAVALALARKGRSVQVLESSADFREVGAGIQLGPNVFRMFELLGLTEAINASAVFPDNLVMRDGLSGEEVTRIPLGDAFRARFKYPYAVIHRPDLHQAILDAGRRPPPGGPCAPVTDTPFEGAGAAA